jgi:hypothetical protein
MINVDLAVAILIGLVDHVLELLVIDSLSELCHAGEVAEGDPGGVVVEQLACLDTSMSSRGPSHPPRRSS